jgi:hypothetical protein
MWAVKPLPQIIAETSEYYQDNSCFLYALSTACVVSVFSDPYTSTTPFRVRRLKAFYRIVKLLPCAAAEPDAFDEQARKVNKGSDLESLKKIDLVSLCQVMNLMFTRYVPMAHFEDWSLLQEAEGLLEDLASIPGRERTNDLIQGWFEEPDGDMSKVFFDYAVAQPVMKLASFGLEVIKTDFDQGRDLCA